MANPTQRTITVQIPDNLDLSPEQIDHVLSELRGKLVQTLQSPTVTVYEKAEPKGVEVAKAETVKQVAQEVPKVQEVVQKP